MAGATGSSAGILLVGSSFVVTGSDFYYELSVFVVVVVSSVEGGISLTGSVVVAGVYSVAGSDGVVDSMVGCV